MTSNPVFRAAVLEQPCLSRSTDSYPNFSLTTQKTHTQSQQVINKVPSGRPGAIAAGVVCAVCSPCFSMRVSHLVARVKTGDQLRGGSVLAGVRHGAAIEERTKKSGKINYCAVVLVVDSGAVLCLLRSARKNQAEKLICAVNCFDLRSFTVSHVY